MFFIVVYHLFIHNKTVTGDAYYNVALTTIFSIGVPVFVMISGYFKIKASVRGFLNIVFQVLFYSFIADVLCAFVFKEPLSTGNILGTIFPVTKTQYWFVGTYLLLYIVSPFLNRYLESISRKEFLVFLVTDSLLVCYCGGVMNVHESDCGDRSLLTFVFLYSIGRFIRVHLSHFSRYVRALNERPWLVYIMVTCVFFILVSFMPPLLSRGVNFLARAYNTIGLTLFSILFFFCFKNLQIQKKWINLMAQSTFAIYLIHGNNIVTYHRWIYNPYTSIGIQINSIHLRLLYLLISALLICFACILVDRIRILLFKYVGVEWVINRIDSFAKERVLKFNYNS